MGIEIRIVVTLHDARLREFVHVLCCVYKEHVDGKDEAQSAVAKQLLSGHVEELDADAASCFEIGTVVGIVSLEKRTQAGDLLSTRTRRLLSLWGVRTDFETHRRRREVSENGSARRRLALLDAACLNDINKHLLQLAVWIVVAVPSRLLALFGSDFFFDFSSSFDESPDLE